MNDYSYPLTENEDTIASLLWVKNDIHPDGQPWKKCCNVCAYTDKKGNRLDCSSRNRKDVAHALAHGARFFCIHQDDNGFYRVCAGWHARDGRHFNGKRFQEKDNCQGDPRKDGGLDQDIT